MAVDGSGNLYIADTFNHRVRKVDTAGVITTFAGTGTVGYNGDGGPASAAWLNRPYGVAVDGSGNLYIADTFNQRIRKVDTAGVITTFAGTGTTGYSGDGSAATAARISGPNGVAVDGSGNIYIADTFNYRVRKVDTAGVITTVAGTGTAGYSGDGSAATAARISGPNGVAVDGSGNIYASDASNNRIRKVDAATGNISTAAGGGSIGDGGAAVSARLNFPYGAALDRAGNIYIADTDNQRIRKVDTAGVITTVAGTGTDGDGGDGGPAASAQLNYPRSVALDAAGNLYIADRDNHRIRKVDTAGNISTAAGTGTPGRGGDGGPADAAQLRFPSGAALDTAGNIYIADTFNQRIRKVDTAGVITTVAGRGAPGFGLGDGIPAISTQLFYPHSVALDGAGNLYIADTFNHNIRKVDTAGVITTVAGTRKRGGSGDGGPAVSARLNLPRGVAVDGAGNLYIADTGNNRIRKVDAATGNIDTLAGTGTNGYNCCGEAAAAQLNYPFGVALDRAGNIYIADTFNHRVRKVGPPPPLPTVEPVSVSELSFEPEPDAEPDEPMSQPLTLRATEGATDFEAVPSARWIEVSRWEGAASWKGRLAAGETIVLRVTVNPLGLRPGTHRGYIYIRSGGRTARVRIVLEVPPPTGPDVSESGGVFNAARMSAYGEAGLFGPQALPVAPGSAVVVQGVNFAPGGAAVEAEGYPLPTMLGGTRVRIDGAEAPLFAVGPQRIEAQLPWALGGEALQSGGLDLVELVVEAADGESSYPRRFWIAPHAPGVFTFSGQGSGQAMAVFAGTTWPAAPLGAFANSLPARAGEILEIYATGLGAVEPPLADGRNSCAPDGVCLADGSNAVLRHTTARPRVWIGAHELAPENILFSGLAPSFTALNMVVVEVPRNVPPSAAAEIVIAIGGRRSQSGVTIAVE